jgi:hypothetical protein
MGVACRITAARLRKTTPARANARQSPDMLDQVERSARLSRQKTPNPHLSPP